MRFRARINDAARQREDGMLPMINVVFLLLIFFMLAGHLSAIDLFDIEATTTESEGPAQSQDALLLVGQYGRLALDGTDIPEQELPATLKQLAGVSPDVVLRIKADGRLAATRVVAILRQVQNAGIGSVELLAEPGSR